MNYKITKQFPNQAETDCARFATELDAKVAIQALFGNDLSNKTTVIYRLYDKYGDLSMTLDSAKDQANPTHAGSQTTSGAGSSQTSGFRPTPFSTTPTPPGGPKKWTQFDDDKEEDEK